MIIIAKLTISKNYFSSLSTINTLSIEEIKKYNYEDKDRFFYLLNFKTSNTFLSDKLIF